MSAAQVLAWAADLLAVNGLASGRRSDRRHLPADASDDRAAMCATAALRHVAPGTGAYHAAVDVLAERITLERAGDRPLGETTVSAWSDSCSLSDVVGLLRSTADAARSEHGGE